MLRVYIAGCGGMLGEAFHKRFSRELETRCTDIDVNEDWLTFCDIRDFRSYREDVLAFSPNYLFHLGAHTDLEFCEQNPEATYLTNTLAVENAVYIANELDIPLLFIGSAGIFNGKKEVYDDWDFPNPLSHYARSKYAAELFVRQNARRYLVCRAGWMMGGGPRKDKKFIHKILRQVREDARELHVVNDKLGTPTYTHDFAENVSKLLTTEYWGLYNMVCRGVTSRLEVVRELIDMLGLKHRIRICEVPSSHFAADYFAPRPASEGLVNRKLDLRGLDVMRDWRVALREYVETYYREYLANVWR